jgi:hypothetical protein
MRASKTQGAAILAELINARGAFVPLPEILKHAAQYSARIHELRRMGFKIENKTEIRDGVRHSWFRLENHQPVSNTRAESQPTTLFDVSRFERHKDLG